MQLSRQGSGRVAPNPLVGCVIVHDGQIIGEGWHKAFGGPHAEVNAIASTGLDRLPDGSTVYVNLEPCAHFGKTPPCCELLIAHRASQVVIGMKDPFEQVSGKGIARLKESGTKVMVGVLEEACRQNDPSFYYSIESGLPYVTLKWAQSSDGFIAPTAQAERSSFRLSSAETDVISHTWRVEHQAILVGSRTVLNDNPRLDVRHVHGKAPLRMILDRKGISPQNSNIFDGSVETWVFGKAASNKVRVIADDGSAPIDQILRMAQEQDIRSLYVEGGAELLAHFIASGKWNEARVIHTPGLLAKGVTAPVLEGTSTRDFNSGSDIIRIYHNG